MLIRENFILTGYVGFEVGVLVGLNEGDIDTDGVDDGYVVGIRGVGCKDNKYAGRSVRIIFHLFGENKKTLLPRMSVPQLGAALA